MITREEYNNVIDVVEAYHKQLFVNSINNDLRILGKTEWDKWDKLNKHCSTRLKNIILKNPGCFLEDITYDFFIKFGNAGKKTWNEFVELRNKSSL